jgi:hypothetical protein
LNEERGKKNPLWKPYLKTHLEDTEREDVHHLGVAALLVVVADGSAHGHSTPANPVTVLLTKIIQKLQRF